METKLTNRFYLHITKYSAVEYLQIKDAAIQSECRIIIEKKKLVIVGKSMLTCISQFEVFKGILSGELVA